MSALLKNINNPSRKLLKTATIALAFGMTGYGGIIHASEVQDQVDQITKKYEPQWNEIKQEGESLADEAPEGAETTVGVDIDCENKEKEVKLDIPEVTMKTQKMALHLPQVTMKTNRIVWDEPHTYMGTTVCGKYPEFRDLRVTMKDILCDLPQVRMERKEAKIDIPEFRWERTDFSMDIPEVKMVTQRWVFDLPDCKIKDVSIEKKKMEEKSKALQSRSANLAKNQQSEINQVVVSNLTEKRNQVDAAFRDGIVKLDEAVNVVKSYGMDPAKVKQEDGSFVNLLEKIQELDLKRKEEVAKLDEKIGSLTS